MALTMTQYLVISFVGLLATMSLLKAKQYHAEVNQQIETSKRAIQQGDILLAKAQSENLGKDKSIESLKYSLDEVTRERDVLIESENRLKEELAQADNEILEMENEMSEDSISTADQIQQLQDELKIAQDELLQMSEDSTSTADQIQQLQDELKKAQDELAAAQEQPEGADDKHVEAAAEGSAAGDTVAEGAAAAEDVAEEAKADEDVVNEGTADKDVADEGTADEDTATDVYDAADGTGIDVVATDTDGEDAAEQVENQVSPKAKNKRLSKKI